MSNEPEKRTTADMAVDRIISDLSGRKGLDDMWYGIDSETREEIRKTWVRYVSEECSNG